MKDIGYTSEGNPLIEMTREEYSEFVSLRDAVEGSESDPFRMDLRKFEQGFDFSSVFGVIRAYYLNHFEITRFQMLLNSMREGLNNPIDRDSLKQAAANKPRL